MDDYYRRLSRGRVRDTRVSDDTGDIDTIETIEFLKTGRVVCNKASVRERAKKKNPGPAYLPYNEIPIKTLNKNKKKTQSDGVQSPDNGFAKGNKNIRMIKYDGRVQVAARRRTVLKYCNIITAHGLTVFASDARTDYVGDRGRQPIGRRINRRA